MAYTFPLDEIRTHIRDVVNESDMSLSDSDIDVLINEAINDIAMQAGAIKGIHAVSTVLNVRTVNADYVRVDAVEYVTGGTALTQITPSQVGRGQFNGVYPVNWFPIGPKIAIDPLPNNAFALNLYTSDYPTADLATDDALAEIPKELNLQVILYVVGSLLSRDGRVGDAEEVMGMYNNDLVFETNDTINSVEDGKVEVKFPYYSGRTEVGNGQAV